MLRFLPILLLLFTSISSMAATVEGLRLSQSSSDTRLVFDLSGQIKYQLFTLQNPERLVIDLENTNSAQSLTLPTLSQTPIRNIRFGNQDQTTLRVVLDLKKPLQTTTQSLTQPHRLVIDLHDTSKATPPALTPKVKQASAVIKKEEVKPPVIKTVVPSPPPPKQKIIIAIDAGHGGQDPGALGKNGTKEKTVVLSIAKRLAKLVNAEPGMKAYLTRDNDIFISLRQRIKRARKHDADMFISIHADAFKNTKAKGASVFVLSERGASSEAAQWLADKENSADLAGGISLEDKDDLLASVLLDLSQTASLEASLEVANTVLSGLKRVGNVHKKQVGSAAFVVLKSPDIPSILVETAFISNPSEERKLKSSNHQNKLARAMMSGIRNYFQRNPVSGSTVPQQHIVSRGDTLSMLAQRYQVSMVQLKSSNNLSSSKLKIGDILLIP